MLRAGTLPVDRFSMPFWEVSPGADLFFSLFPLANATIRDSGHHESSGHRFLSIAFEKAQDSLASGRALWFGGRETCKGNVVGMTRCP